MTASQNSSRTPTEVFEDHLMKRLAGDVEGDIKENYSPDVILLTGTGAFSGHDGVRESARQLTGYIGSGTFTFNHTLVKGPYAFLEWTANDKDRLVCDGADSFYIQNGKITMQSIHYSVTKKE